LRSPTPEIPVARGMAKRVDKGYSAALNSFPNYINAFSTIAAGMQRCRALSSSCFASDDFYSMCTRLFAPSISTTPKSMWPMKMEAWVCGWPPSP
jgi:hypothetical protein